MSNPFVIGPDPIVQQANQQVAQELGLEPGPTTPTPSPLDNADPRTAVVNSGMQPDYLKNIGGPLDVAASMDKNQVPYSVAPDAQGKPQVVPVAAQQAAQSAPSADQFATPKAGTTPQTPTLQNVQLPEEAKAYTAEFEKQKQANAAIATAESHKAAADAAAFDSAKQAVAVTQSKLADLHNKFESDFSARMSDMDAVTKQIANQDFTAPKIDEGHFWASRSTPQSIMAGIAIALGAVGGGFSGTGKNSAVDIINKAIDRDIEVQKMNAQMDMQGKQMKAQNLRDQLGAKQTMLSTLRAKYGDETQAELAQKAMALEATQMQIQKNASMTANTEVLKKYEILNSQIEQQKQMTTMQLKQQMYQRAVLQQALGEGDPTKIPASALATLDPESRKIFEERRERWVPGWGEALTKEGATKFREQSAEARTALDGISEIKRLSGQLHALSPLTDRAKVEEVRTRLTSLIGNVNKSLNKTNRLSEVDVHLAEKILGDPTANLALKSVQMQKLNTVGKILQNDVNNIAESNGIQKRVNPDFDNVSFPTKPLK